MIITSYLRSTAHRFLFWLLSKLPNRSKRMVFIVSLTQRFRAQEQIDPRTLAKLNSIMAIDTSESSMWMPAQLAQIIWNDQSVKSICNTPTPQYAVLDEHAISQLCEAVVNGQQRCLQYGPAEVIMKDLHALVKGAPLFGVRTTPDAIQG